MPHFCDPSIVPASTFYPDGLLILPPEWEQKQCPAHLWFLSWHKAWKNVSTFQLQVEQMIEHYIIAPVVKVFGVILQLLEILPCGQGVFSAISFKLLEQNLLMKCGILYDLIIWITYGGPVLRNLSAGYPCDGSCPQTSLQGRQPRSTSGQHWI